MINFNISEAANKKSHLDVIKEIDTASTNEYTINLELNNTEQKGLAFNTIDAINSSMDKDNLIQILRTHKILAPRIIIPGNKTTFPIIGRKFDHRNGTDIKLVDNLSECTSKELDYYQKHYHFKKEYVVHICDLDIISFQEKYTSQPEDNNELIIRTKAFGYKLKDKDVSDLSSKDKDKIYNLTTRALSVTGLDFGYVSIGIGENNKLYVIDVDSDITRLDVNTFEKYIHSLIKMVKKYEHFYVESNDVTLGADPELLLKDTEDNTLYPASLFIKNNQEIGLDSRTLESNKKYYPILEIRPQPSHEPLKLYENIKDIILSLQEIIKYKNIGIYAGSAPKIDYWLGGHIHFGMKPTSKLIKTLDNYLALPIMSICNTSTLRQRNKFYGNLSNFRNKKYGGFEYCTLSSWLVSKDIIKGILSLAKLISIEFLNLQTNFFTSYIHHKAYYDVKKHYFYDINKEIINDIKATKSYNIYKTEIDILFDMILNHKVWQEERSLKDVFKLKSSEDTFELKNIVYVPILKRKLFNLNLDDKINVLFGKKSYELTVLPLDDYSPNKDGYVSFSSNIYKELNFKDKIRLDMFRVNEKTYKCGPIIGIHCDKQFSSRGPFKGQSLLFKRFIKLAKEKGIIAYVFSLENIDYEQGTVDAMSYDFSINQWYNDTYPLPDVIYDRGLNIIEYFYGNRATKFKEYYRNNNLKAINDFKAINTISNKVYTTDLLKTDRQTQQFLPETLSANRQNLYYMLDKHKKIYLKILDGSKGSLIYCIRQSESQPSKFSIIHRDKDRYIVTVRTDYESIYEELLKLMKDDNVSIKNYIVQQGIKFLKYKGRPYELRILLAKNGKGIWTRVAMVGRVRTSNKEFLGLYDHETKSSKIFKHSLGDNEPIVRDHIYTLINNVITVLEANHIEAGELAIDLGITKNLDLYIIELNSKPDSLLSYIGAFKLRNLYINRLLDYSKYLIK